MATLSGPLADPQLRRRLRHLARAVHVLIALGAPLFVGGALWCWSSPERALDLLRRSGAGAVQVGPQVQVMGALFTLIPMAVSLLAMWRLWCVFDEYGQGRVFSQRALRSLRGFARWLMVDAFVSPVYGAALSVLGTWNNGPGKRALTLGVGSGDYIQLLFALVILAICSVMVEAARVAEDNEGFV
jgi:hypothetical protein